MGSVKGDYRLLKEFFEGVSCCEILGELLLCFSFLFLCCESLDNG